MQVIKQRLGLLIDDGSIEFSYETNPGGQAFVRIEIRERLRTAFANVPIDEWDELVAWLDERRGEEEGLT